MPLSQSKRKQLFALCERLRENDPTLTVFDLCKYGTIEWKDAMKLAKALEHNTAVTEVSLYLFESGMSPESTVPFAYFLRTSPSLRRLTLWGDDDYEENHSSTSILEAVSHSKSLTSLVLDGIVCILPEALEELLASTQTLKEFKFVESEYDSGNTMEVAQALRRGFERNRTLEKLEMEWKGVLYLEDVIFGLTEHSKLKSLILDIAFATEVSSQALRFFLKGSETLEQFEIYWRSDSDKFPTVTPILLGLACNRSVKIAEFSLPVLDDSQIPACAAAWTEMLRRNSTMEVLQFDLECDIKIGPECAAGIVDGLSENVALQELYLGQRLEEGAFYGPNWEHMLDRNQSLKELGLRACYLGAAGATSFGAFARGLSPNTSLKELNLKDNGIGNDGAMELADALRGNKVLERLDLSSNGIDGPEAVTVIKALWESKSLTHLYLSDNTFGGNYNDRYTVFPEGLPKNTTFECLDLDGCHLNPGDLLAIFECFDGSTSLRELNLGQNCISLDDSCGATLKRLIERTSLRLLYFCSNEVTSEGMTELVEGLQSNLSLVELSLSDCGIDNEGLFKLGEGLVENKTLESLALEENEFDTDGLSQFFGILPRMKGLKKLELNSADISDETVGLALLDGIRVNTSLEIIEGIEESELSPAFKESIDFYLQMNRNGRRYLGAPLANRMPLGAWPHILTKLSPVSERDQLFYFLRNKADLVQCEKTLKRKADDRSVVSSSE